MPVFLSNHLFKYMYFNADCALGSLNYVDVSNVVSVSEVHTVFLFRIKAIRISQCSCMCKCCPADPQVEQLWDW
jgi:hypothetical protein